MDPQYGTPIWNPNMEPQYGPQYGPPLWTSNMDIHMDHKHDMDPQYGTPIWNPNMDPQYGPPICMDPILIMPQPGIDL
jgi:hypothetical protein